MKRKIHIAYYLFLKALIRFSLNRFYKRRDTVGYQENVPKNTPLIFTGNHQNALIDPLNIVCSTPPDRQPSFLTRSDVFVGKVKAILYSFKMLPIYRLQDGVDPIVENEKIFQICVDRLANDESIIIFPEGNHNMERRIRPLKKGAARISFQAEEANNFELGIQIVPVGLNYEHHKKFRADILINYGKPIPLADYYEEYKVNPRRALLLITKAIRAGMREVVIDIPNKVEYDVIERLRQSFGSDHAKELGLNPHDQYDVFKAEKKLIAALEEDFKAETPENTEIKAQTRHYIKGVKDLKMRDHIFANPPTSRLGLILIALGLIITLPIHIFGVINNYLAYKLSDEIAIRNFKDHHFHSSIKFAAGLVLVPLFYLIIFGIAWIITDVTTALLYLVSLPLTGRFAIFYSEQVKKWYSKWRYLNLAGKKDELLESVIKARKAMREFMKKLVSSTPRAEEVSNKNAV